MIRNPIDYAVCSSVIETIADPAAGASLPYSVSANSVIEPICLSFRVDTDGNAADRQMNFKIGLGAAVITVASCDTKMVANTVKTFVFGTQAEGYTNGLANTYFTPIQRHLLLTSGYVIYLTIDSIQVGDQIDEAIIFYKRWIYRSV